MSERSIFNSLPLSTQVAIMEEEINKQKYLALSLQAEAELLLIEVGVKQEMLLQKQAEAIK